MAIHPFESAGQLEIVPGLYFATDTQHIEWLLTQEDAEKHVRFFVGYSGWSPGQLENELEAGSWLTAPATIDRIFAPEEALWRSIKRELSLEALTGKVNPKLIPSDPSMN